MTRAKFLLRSRAVAATAAVLLLAGTAGCEYLKWAGTEKLQRAEYKRDPSLLLEKELAPENCFALIGHVILPGGEPKSVLVVALDHSNPSHPQVGQREATADTGYYGILLPAGSYDLLLFADINGDGFYETNEVVARTPPDSPVAVDEKLTSEGLLVAGPDLTLDLKAPGVSETAVRVKVSSSPFVVTSLDEPIFDPALGELGVYYPNQFLTRVQRWVFSAGEPDFKKTQVVLVHGINGTPRDFSTMVAGIDHSQYQIWLFYYPSGLHLDNLGIILSHAIETLAAYPKSTDLKLVLVAHSMGGLVGRRAVNELCRKGKPPYLKGMSPLTPLTAGSSKSSEPRSRAARSSLPGGISRPTATSSSTSMRLPFRRISRSISSSGGASRVRTVRVPPGTARSPFAANSIRGPRPQRGRCSASDRPMSASCPTRTRSSRSRRSWMKQAERGRDASPAFATQRIELSPTVWAAFQTAAK